MFVISMITRAGGKDILKKPGLSKNGIPWSKGPSANPSLTKGEVELGHKLDYVFGKATGNAHNIERAQSMLRQLESVGLFDNKHSRFYLTSHFKEVERRSDNILSTQSNGRVVRESLIMGPQGGLKAESVWQDTKLITVKLYGGR